MFSAGILAAQPTVSPHSVSKEFVYHSPASVENLRWGTPSHFL